MRERRCLVTGATAEEAALVRFVAGPDGAVVPDLSARLPGRGLWVTATRAAIDQAVAKKLFARAAKAPVTAAPGLSGVVEELLAAKCLELLGLARRAGEVTFGADKVSEALRGKEAGRVTALVEASDGEADGRRKILAAARAGGVTEVPVFGCFSASEMGLALGRDHVVHAALFRGGLAERVASEARRLGGFRLLAPDAWSLPVKDGLPRLP